MIDYKAGYLCGPLLQRRWTPNTRNACAVIKVLHMYTDISVPHLGQHDCYALVKRREVRKWILSTCAALTCFPQRRHICSALQLSTKCLWYAVICSDCVTLLVSVQIQPAH